jgi:hypothetical protein
MNILEIELMVKNKGVAIVDVNLVIKSRTKSEKKK